MHILAKLAALLVLAAFGAVLLYVRPPAPAAGELAVEQAQAMPRGHETDRDIRYGRDIRPILSENCFLCHGPDEGTRQAGLRLDLPEEALALRDGQTPIVPGDLEASELWRRINAHGDEVMPPPESEKRPLSDEQRNAIRQWILAGAEYEEHWSFIPPVRSQPPVVAGNWARNEIDHFILAELHRHGLEPNPEEEPNILFRRLFLDLTGLPPTIEELNDFLNDMGPDAYERWVDRLLTEEPYRTRYAERMAVPWLDQARYADTIGIHTDAGRSIWPWRDWVLEAYRQNMPFDQFVTEQLAGDLLPEATTAQKVATGFNRAHVVSDEGGAINEEYLVEYAVDRVSTTGSVLLGLTMNCARCHDHKFDPITQEDFYGLVAFFNSIEEPGVYSQLPDPKRAFEPFMEVPTPEQSAERERLTEAIAAATAARDLVPPEEAQQREAFLAETLAAAGVRWETPNVTSAESSGGATLAVQEDGSILAGGANPDQDEHRIVLRTESSDLRLLMLEVLADASLANGRVGRAPNGNAVLTGIEAEAVSVTDPANRKPVKFQWAWADIEQQNGDFRVVNVFEPDGGEGWAVDAHNVEGNRLAVLLAEEAFGFEGGTELHVTLKYDSRYPQHAFGRVRLSAGALGDGGLAKLPDAASGWYIAGPFPGDRNEIFDAAHGPEEPTGLDLKRTFTPGNIRWAYDQSIRDAVIKLLPAGPNVFYIARRLYSPAERELELSLGSDDGIRVYVNGEEAFQNKIERGPLPDQDRATIKLRRGRNDLVIKIVNTGGPGGFYYRAVPPETRLGHELFAALLPAEVRAGRVEEAMIHAWRTTHSPAYRAATAQVTALEQELADLQGQIPLTMIMSELPTPRETFVLDRGLYDQPDKNRPVHRNIPRILGDLPHHARFDRLGLAEWIVSEHNPLTARVTVNRLWEQVFGMGIVATSDDFGMQGQWPSHPELLDWLAVEFREGGWDVQAMIRRIVTSSTYRQSSRAREDAAALDPENRLLSHYPRQRLSAEQIRDLALYTSGLLVEKPGGPSVKPYQPDGLWQEVSMPQSNTRNYEQGSGEDLWRRSLYTYWKRAVPPPSMLMFDAPTREFCVTRRLTTNTPLQALVLWNDVQFVEAARVLAERVIRETDDDAARVRTLARRCTSAEPAPKQVEAMLEVLAEFRERYAASPDDARSLVGTGMATVPVDIPPEEVAAWTMLASAVLSADAAISKN